MEFNKTLKNFGALTKTLADNKDELFGTLTKVENFTSTLAKNDDTVRKFNDSLASGADLLAGERAGARGGAAEPEHRDGRRSAASSRRTASSLTRNISGLNQISKTLVKRRDALDKILQYAPAALNNLYLAGNVAAGHARHPRQPRRAPQPADGQPGRAALCTLVEPGRQGGEACCTLIQARPDGPAPGPRAPVRGRPVDQTPARGRADRPLAWADSWR